MKTITLKSKRQVTLEDHDVKYLLEEWDNFCEHTPNELESKIFFANEELTVAEVHELAKALKPKKRKTRKKATPKVETPEETDNA